MPHTWSSRTRHSGAGSSRCAIAARKAGISAISSARSVTYAKAGVVPFALRSSDWKFKPKTRIALQVGEFIGAGGKAVMLAEHELRAVVAARAMSLANPAGLAEWRQATCPLSQLGFVRNVLDLDKISTASPAAPPRPPRASSEPAASPTPVPAPPPRRISSPILAVGPAQIRLGTTTTMRAEPIYLPAEHLKTHVAFLGTTGSGKTTAALGMVEQLLERGVSVLLVDRKGDLARYATDAWWADPASPDHARKADLRARIEVELFTPGNPRGRPLGCHSFPRCSTPARRSESSSRSLPRAGSPR